MSLSFPSLLYFKKAAELQHLTNAAKELHIAQPSLSRAISSMEGDLGVKLFERQGRNVQLTQYGKIVLDYAQVILDDLHEMKRSIDTAKDPENSTVTVSYYAASRIISPFLDRFRKEHPDTIIRLLRSHANVLSPGAEPLGTPEADLVLSTSHRPVQNKRTTTLFKEPIVLALRADDPLTKQPYVDALQLRSQRFVFFPEGFAIRSIILDYFKSLGITPNVVAYSDNPATVAEYIRSGLGAAIVPKFSWNVLAARDIAFLPISEPGLYRYITLTDMSHPDSPRKAFVSNLTDYFTDSFAQFLNHTIRQ